MDQSYTLGFGTDLQIYILKRIWSWPDVIRAGGCYFNHQLILFLLLLAVQADYGGGRAAESVGHAGEPAGYCDPAGAGPAVGGGGPGTQWAQVSPKPLTLLVFACMKTISLSYHPFCRPPNICIIELGSLSLFLSLIFSLFLCEVDTRIWS